VYDELVAIKLVKPFQKNLLKKKAAMKTAIDGFGKLISYESATSPRRDLLPGRDLLPLQRALTESERPDNLNAWSWNSTSCHRGTGVPFEEKAIATHEKNVELLTVGVPSLWIEKSIGKLATLVPARYAKPSSARLMSTRSAVPAELHLQRPGS